MTIKIDAGIPIPVMTRTGKASKYPFRLMRIHDSFTIAWCKERTYAPLYTCAKHAGIRITIRRTGNMIRVWRIASDVYDKRQHQLDTYQRLHDAASSKK